MQLIQKYKKKLPLIVGLFLCFLSFFLFSRDRMIFADFISTEGRLIEYKNKRLNKNTVYCPVVKFTTNQGKEVVFESNVCEGGPLYAEEDQVMRIIYNPNNPQDAHLNSFLKLYVKSIIPLFFGLVFLLPSFLSFLSKKTNIIKEVK